MFIAAGVFGVPRYEHRRPSMPRESFGGGMGYPKSRAEGGMEGYEEFYDPNLVKLRIFK